MTERIGPHTFDDGVLCLDCGASRAAARMDEAGRRPMNGRTYAHFPKCRPLSRWLRFHGFRPK